MNSINHIKYRFQNAGIVEKLIYINVGVFLLVHLLNVVGFLFQSETNILVKWLSLPDTFQEFIIKPWTLVSYGFLHTGFIHILSNLVALFFIGNLFRQYFTYKQLLNFYLLGTVFGGIIYLISYNSFPVFTQGKEQNVLLGASAGISAIFVGIATYIPNYEIKIPLIGFVKLWILAAIWVAMDVIQIPSGNAGGHLAHLGGTLFGFLYVKLLGNKDFDLRKQFEKVFKKNKKPFKTVYKSKNKQKQQPSNKENQQQVDIILDKISKSGYNALTKAEKEFLFKQGK